MIEAAVLVFFPVLMVFAAFSDAATMTISNRVSIALALGFAPIALLAGATSVDLVMHFLCGAAVFALAFAMFAFRIIGGGDAKLAAATALWLGWDTVGNYGLTTAVLGGFLSIGLLAARKCPMPEALLRREWIARLYHPQTGIPYGMALATAGLLVYPESLVWLKTVAA